jgi:hypothetical protein
MFYVDGQLEVFLATSIGVLSTTTLNAGSTVWAQEAASEIGNVIAGYMDYRDSDKTLAIATHGRGVFTTRFTGGTGVGDPPPGASRVTLRQSVPNPARDAARIGFDLPREADVSLRLFDVSGRQVAVLANGRRDAGHHEVPLDARRLTSGVYTYVLRAGSAVETRRLVVRR